MDQFIKFISTGFGVGYLPFAPGTFGTLWGSLVFWALQGESFLNKFLSFIFLVVVSVVFSHFGETAFGQKDCQKIVIDEVAGVFVCYLFVPFSWTNLVLGFLLFRFFDIMKLYPADWCQNNLKGGWGVAADDLVAGLQAGVVLLLIHFVLDQLS